MIMIVTFCHIVWIKVKIKPTKVEAIQLYQLHVFNS